MFFFSLFPSLSLYVSTQKRQEGFKRAEISFDERRVEVVLDSNSKFLLVIAPLDLFSFSFWTKRNEFTGWIDSSSCRLPIDAMHPLGSWRKCTHSDRSNALAEYFMLCT